MTKGQIAAVFLAGAGVGAAPQAVLSALTTTSVSAAPTHPTAHAVDLRRDYSGANFHFAAYGNRAVADAGYVDLGQAKKCSPLTAKQQEQLGACMALAGNVCEW